jgi:hypothetical protein
MSYPQSVKGQISKFSIYNLQFTIYNLQTIIEACLQKELFNQVNQKELRFMVSELE